MPILKDSAAGDIHLQGVAGFVPIVDGDLVIINENGTGG
jgi:hypothetical protein